MHAYQLQGKECASHHQGDECVPPPGKK